MFVPPLLAFDPASHSPRAGPANTTASASSTPRIQQQPMVEANQLPQLRMTAKSSKSVRSLSTIADSKVALIAAMLKHPDDLATLSAIRQRLAREKAIVDQQLKNGVQAQMEETREALDILGTTKEQVLGIKGNMKNIDSLCKDAQGRIVDYPRIRQISQTHQNFVKTQNLVNNFQELHQDLDRIKRTMREERENILGPAPSLLLLHFQLHKLEELRDLTMHQAKDEPLDVVVTLKQYFGRLDQVLEEFNEYLWDLSRNMIQLIQKKQGSVVVRLIKIIESEESADTKALTLKSEASSKKNKRASSAGLLGANKKNEKPTRTVKSLRSKFFDVLHDEVSNKFKLMLENVDTDPMECLEATDFVFPDLALVYDDLVPRSPSNYKIFPFFVLEYHRHVYELSNKIVASKNLDGGMILHLLRWVREYYANMNHQLGVTEELLEPQLLDGNEQGLLDEYLKLVRKKLVEWTTNMMNTTVAEFTARDKPPEKDQDQLYHMSIASILFQMINQQITIASDANQSKIMEQVVGECLKVMRDCQQRWKTTIASEYKKQIDTPEEAPLGLVEYVMAATNDQIRCAEFTEALVERVGTMISTPKTLDNVRDQLNNTMDDFFDVATFGVNTLLDLCFNDIKGVLAKLHCSSWYEEDLMVQYIIVTLKDYSEDFRSHLNDYMFNKTMDWMLERLMIAVIDSLRNKSAKLKFPACVDRLQADRAAMFNFFAAFKPTRELEQDFDAIEQLHKFVTSSKKTAFLAFYEMKAAYPDLPMALVEDVTSRRDDFDRTAVKDLMEQVKTKYNTGKDAPVVKSIFSKVKQ